MLECRGADAVVSAPGLPSARADAARAHRRVSGGASPRDALCARARGAPDDRVGAAGGEPALRARRGDGARLALAFLTGPERRGATRFLEPHQHRTLLERARSSRTLPYPGMFGIALRPRAIGTGGTRWQTQPFTATSTRTSAVSSPAGSCPPTTRISASCT